MKLKNLRSPTSGYKTFTETPTFLLEKEQESISGDGSVIDPNSGRRNKNNVSGVITEISNSTFEKTVGPPIPMDFALPINMRSKAQKMNS